MFIQFSFELNFEKIIVNSIDVQKKVKQNLLGLQKCYLSVGVVSLQLAMMNHRFINSN